jgi:tetratricopeptide (TPR) repeat protein
VKAVAAALLLAAGCRPGSGDPELAGDRAYGAGRFAAASVEYHASLARDERGRVRAKAAAAALHAGSLALAAADYRHLATSDPTRVDEAADGLARTAHAAELAGDSAGLAASVLALHDVAPRRVLGRPALAVVRRVRLAGGQDVAILPSALAVADAPALVDSLLVRYGAALEQTSACEDAADAWGTVLRRSADSGLRHDAARGLDACGLRLGLTALSGGRPADAARWLGRVADHDSSSWTARRALIGLGDALRSQGDTARAAAAFERAAALGGPDSLSQLAAGRLRALAPSQSAGDSARTGDQ